jgi:hypothetical protein
MWEDADNTEIFYDKEEIVDEHTSLLTNNQIPLRKRTKMYLKMITGLVTHRLQECMKHVNKISQSIGKNPGWILALDKMLTKLMGRVT